MKTTRIELNLPAADYRKAEGVSKSQLTDFDACPKLFKAAQDGLIQREETAAMQFGTIAHALLLENRDDTWHVRPEGMKFTTKDGMAWRAAHRDRPILTGAENDELYAMREAFRAHPHVAPLIASGQPEVSLFGEIRGVKVKARADWLAERHILDVKTTTDASDRAVIGFIAKWKSFLQSGLYLRLAQQNGLNCFDFYFVFIQRGAVPALNVWHMSAEDVRRGDIYLDALIDRYKLAVETNRWPDYSGDEPQPRIKTLPDFVFRERADKEIETIDLEETENELELTPGN